MVLDYVLLDESYQPSAEAQERIDMDVECVGAAFRRSEIQPLVVVDGEECEKASRELVRVLGYDTQTPTIPKIIYTTGAPLRGMMPLSKPLEELAEKELDSIAKKIPLRFDLLLKLQESARKVTGYQ